MPGPASRSPSSGPFSLLSTQSCLTSALQTPVTRKGPTSARTSWATSIASAETAGQGGFAAEVRLRPPGRWGHLKGRPRAWAGGGHSHTSLSGCNRSEGDFGGCQLCGGTGPSLVGSPKGQMGGRDHLASQPPGGLDIWAAGVLPLPQAGLRPA